MMLPNLGNRQGESRSGRRQTADTTLARKVWYFIQVCPTQSHLLAVEIEGRAFLLTMPIQNHADTLYPRARALIQRLFQDRGRL